MSELLRMAAGLASVVVLVRLARRSTAERRAAGLAVATRRRPARARVGRRERERTARELAVAVELVRMAVGAGMTPAGALRVVAESRLGPVRQLAERVGAGVGAGLSFREACRTTATASASPDVARLFDLLSDGERTGAPLAQSLAILGADLRGVLRRRAEERARGVPVTLHFPLVFLALPAFVLLTIAPAVLAALDR